MPFYFLEELLNMSNSNQDTGVIGALLAVGLLVVLVGGGLFIYQRNQAWQEAVVVAELEAVAVQDKAALVAQHVAAKASESTASQLRQVPTVTNDDALTPEADAAVQADIVSKLMAQQSDWNKGDLDAFMKVYWNSEKLTFASGGKVTRGYQATLDGYKAKYSTKEKLGTLTFDNLDFQRLADRVMLVLGTWYLERGDDSIGGNFSLIWQKIDDQWLIVHDHTSKR